MNTLESRSLSGLVALYATRMLGLFMVLPVLSLYGAQYSGSTTFLLGVALGVYGLTQGVLQIPLGMLSDKVGRKAVIVGGMLVFLAGSLIAASTDSIYGLIFGRALQGAGAVASTIMALLSDVTTEENRTKAMAAVGGSIGLSFGVAMILGPLLAASAGLSSIFWLTALLAVLGIALVFFWIPTPVSVSQVTASEALALPKLFSSTLKNTELLRLDFGIFSLHLVQMASWVSVPFLLQHSLDFPLESHWWLYLATMGLGFVAMLPLVIIAERNFKLKQVFILAVALLVIAEFMLFFTASSLLYFGIAMWVFFTAFNLLEATLPSLVSKLAPSGSRGTAMGIYSSSQFLGAFFGGVLGGLLAYRYGHEMVFLGAAIVALLWLMVAATMPVPRHWSSRVVDLALYPTVPVDGLELRKLLPGIEEVTFFPDRQLLYLKVDRQQFDDERLQELLQKG